MEISDQVDLMAREIRNNSNCPKRIGDVINQMETEHDFIEKQKRTTDRVSPVLHKSSIGVNYTSMLQKRETKLGKSEPFDRAAASKMLRAVYPWLDPEHPENPDAIWFAYEAKRTARQVDMLNSSGDLGALNQYRVPPQKSWGRAE